VHTTDGFRDLPRELLGVVHGAISARLCPRGLPQSPGGAALGGGGGAGGGGGGGGGGGAGESSSQVLAAQLGMEHSLAAQLDDIRVDD